VSGDRQALLGRIAANLARGTAGHGHPAAAAPAVPLGAEPHDRAELLARFRAEWQALAGHVHEAVSVADVTDVVAAVCRPRQARHVLAWSEAAIGLDGLDEALMRRGLALDRGMVPRDPVERAARMESLGGIQVGLTGADALLAESGSVVVVSGPGRGRLASLLPPVHIAIARAAKIYYSLEHLLAAEPALGTAGSNFVSISGPSRTADIEMTLTRGVHGPGEVHVILMD
jgi:L-lactate dehydrogenase complex protein LldG